MRQFAQLQQLQKDRCFRQVGDDNFGLCGGDALQLNVNVGRPFALEFFARQGQAFVGRLDVAQRGAGQNHAEKAGYNRRDYRNIADQRSERNAR